MRSGLLTDGQIRRQERRLHRWIGKQFRTAARYTLAQLPDDTVGRVTGRAAIFEERTLVAPLSGRPCVYYRASATGRDVNGATHELVFEECAFPFLLDDGNERAVIVPIFANVSAPFDFTSRSTSTYDLAPAQRALLLRRGGQRLQSNRLVYREAIIGAGETVTICGAGVREPDPDGQLGETDYRTGTALRLRFEGSPKLALLVTSVAGAHTHP